MGRILGFSAIGPPLVGRDGGGRIFLDQAPGPPEPQSQLVSRVPNLSFAENKLRLGLRRDLALDPEKSGPRHHD